MISMLIISKSFFPRLHVIANEGTECTVRLILKSHTPGRDPASFVSTHTHEPEDLPPGTRASTPRLVPAGFPLPRGAVAVSRRWLLIAQFLCFW